MLKNRLKLMITRKLKLSKEELEGRIKAINDQLIKTKENYCTLQGHLNEAQHWLDLLSAANDSKLAQDCEEIPIDAECNDVPQ